MLSNEKHFLDSSVVRPILVGSKPYKQYFQEYFGSERCYVSNYVKMEFLRSFVVPLLDFYFIFDLPSIETIADALALFSNRFRARELKAIIQFVSLIFRSHDLDFTLETEKDKALRAVARVIMRIQYKLERKFRNIGDQGVHCERAKIQLRRKKKTDDFRDLFEKFQDKFLDTKKCRQKCHIDDFLGDRYKSTVKEIVYYASRLESPSRIENKGFIKISEKLYKVLHKNTSLSCRLCESIGDAVISLEAPRVMAIEHTDYSFDHLCQIIDKRHKRHPSESSYLKRSASL